MLLQCTGFISFGFISSHATAESYGTCIFNILGISIVYLNTVSSHTHPILSNSIKLV